jgi:hypothetical protein
MSEGKKSLQKNSLKFNKNKDSLYYKTEETNVSLIFKILASFTK